MRFLPASLTQVEELFLCFSLRIYANHNYVARAQVRADLGIVFA